MDLSGRLTRVRRHGWQVLQCAAGAGVAWLLARAVLGHEAPIFASIAAVVALGVSYGQRRRRVVEVSVGVAVGVLVGDLIVLVAGSGAWQITAAVALAMTVAVFLGAGNLLINQSAVQAVFITTLVPGQGEALDRWLDALTGGLVALLVASVVPAAPLRRPLTLAVALLREVSELLREAATAARAHDATMAHEALEHARGTHVRLDALRSAAAEGLEVAAVTPWRRRRGEVVREVAALAEPLDRALRNVRVLARRMEAALARDEVVPAPLVGCVDALGAASLRLAEDLAAGVELDGVVEELLDVARGSAAVPRSSLSADVVLAQVRSTVVDLLQVTGLDGPEALRRVRAATGG